MCGIVGIVRQSPFQCSDIVSSLKRLEYRGYDSWGMATSDGTVIKKIGEIPKPEIFTSLSASAAIAHTRWATHGGVTDYNAHPHADCSQELFVVHNGILENYADLRDELKKAGHRFRSDTDSEVVAHWFEEKIKKGVETEAAIQEFLKAAEGTFAILIARKAMNKIYAIKRGSPLVLGLLEDGVVLASDIYAFSHRTDKAIWLDDDEWVVADQAGYAIHNTSGKVEKPPQTFEWREEQLIGEYPYFMIKEIHEIPQVSRRLILSLDTDQKKHFQDLANLVKKSQKVIFVASGTSYHAALLGVYFLNKAGIDAQAIIASEFKDYTFVDSSTLVIAISQSGETMDVIEALKSARQRGAKLASLVNVPYSTIQRMSELSLQVLAGQEVCVAATKTFVNQVLMLLALSKELGYKIDIDAVPAELKGVFGQEPEIQKLAQKIKDSHDIYILGRGLAYPVSREIALKLKEISYIHAEGMMGGELKHGTLALIEPKVPVIGLIDNEEIISNLKEVEARGGEITVLADCDTEFKGLRLKTSSEPAFALAATVAGQLLTYYIAKGKNLPIDKPRNLAKSVTVK